MRRFRWTIVLLAIAASGCSHLPPAPAEPVVVPQPEPPEPVAEPEPEPLPETPPATPAPPPPQPSEPMLPKVAVVLSSRSPAYLDVALALDKLLEEAEVYDLSDRSLSPKDAFAAIGSSDAHVVVAIGLRAAIFARGYAAIPVVLSQVFNVAEHDLYRENMRGVAALPPLDKQLAAWLSVAPDLHSVGAIVGPGHEVLLDEARAAAQRHGMAFHSRVASSDREALYLFTRMVPDIDGYWLFPDNRVLSAPVLRETLDYATRHNVQVAVFNDRLLGLGATLSATTSEEDIARTVAEIVRRLHAEGIEAIPQLSPLQHIDIHYNEKLRRRMRLATGQTSGAMQ